MKKVLLVILASIISAGVVFSQPVQQRPHASFEVSEYGVDFQADPRLIVVMAALEAAGFDFVPVGSTPSTFRVKLRKDLANLDPDLRRRLQAFYERNKLPAPATPPDQAGPYVSLPLALRNFEVRSSDLRGRSKVGVPLIFVVSDSRKS